ncbi:hypothetical protein GCM10023082_38160 [Streptomyces tremellae]|uniref:Uncharacterized protein n=1 Tax=Streptomyces tremellae TaxID=1124239 RepID=A0ABP7FDS1_9ACTN
MPSAPTAPPAVALRADRAPLGDGVVVHRAARDHRRGAGNGGAVAVRGLPDAVERDDGPRGDQRGEDAAELVVPVVRRRELCAAEGGARGQRRGPDLPERAGAVGDGDEQERDEESEHGRLAPGHGAEVTRVQPKVIHRTVSTLLAAPWPAASKVRPAGMP